MAIYQISESIISYGETLSFGDSLDTTDSPLAKIPALTDSVFGYGDISTFGGPVDTTNFSLAKIPALTDGVFNYAETSQVPTVGQIWPLGIP
jgi:hypothetical protein